MAAKASLQKTADVMRLAGSAALGAVVLKD